MTIVIQHPLRYVFCRDNRGNLVDGATTQFSKIPAFEILSKSCKGTPTKNLVISLIFVHPCAIIHHHVTMVRKTIFFVKNIL